MKPFHIRYVFCILALFLSLMLLGSARINGEQKSRSRRGLNINTCRVTCQEVSSYIPPENRNEWEELVAQAPELALRSTALKLHELPRIR